MNKVALGLPRVLDRLYEEVVLYMDYRCRLCSLSVSTESGMRPLIWHILEHVAEESRARVAGVGR